MSLTLFLEIIELTAQQLKINSRFIEKDYWVTYVLKNLSNSEFKDKLVFKGGTSLSKAFKLISRFSEDIDLAFYPEDGMTRNQIKQNLKRAENCLTKEFNYLADHPEESKGSLFRKTYHQYPTIAQGEFGLISPHILLEISHFTVPEPKTSILIQSLMADFLQTEKRHDLIDQFELTSFPVYVLDVERTTAEKVMSLIRASCQDDPIKNLRSKIRHIYDLCMIMRSPHYRHFFEKDDLVEMIKIVIDSDKKQFKTESVAWLTSPLKDSILFSEPNEIWPDIKSEYLRLTDVAYADIPSEQEVFLMLEKLRLQLTKINV